MREALGLNEASQQIANLFSGGDEPGNPKGTGVETAVQDIDTDQDADESLEGTLEGQADADLDDESEGQPGAEPEEEGEEDETLDADEKLKKELLADYTRKTMALADERRAFEQQRETVTAEVQAERQEYAAGLAQLAQLLSVATQGVEPDAGLLDTNPTEYMRQKVAADARKEQLAAVQAEQQRVFQRQQAEAAQAREAMLQEQHRQLLEAMPEWQDETVRKAALSKVVDYAKGLGATDQALENLDHLGLMVLHKAMQFDALEARGREVVKQQKVAKPRAGDGKGELKSRRQRKRMERARSTGRVDDAAAAIAGLLER